MFVVVTGETGFIVWNLNLIIFFCLVFVSSWTVDFEGPKKNLCGSNVRDSNEYYISRLNSLKQLRATTTFINRIYSNRYRFQHKTHFKVHFYFSMIFDFI